MSRVYLRMLGECLTGQITKLKLSVRNHIIKCTHVRCTAARPPQSEFVPAIAWATIKCACQNVMSIAPLLSALHRIYYQFEASKLLYGIFKYKHTK